MTDGEKEDGEIAERKTRGEENFERKKREPPVERARSNGLGVVYGWKRRGSAE